MPVAAPPDALAARVLEGDPRAVARAISRLEDAAAGDSASAALVSAIFGRTGRAYLIGITGVPGGGKSTLVDQLIATVRAAGLTVAVLAIDPTSPFSGGAVLGDRVRMGRHAGDRGVFVRSMATRGHLGGLARTTGDAALVLDAAGFDVVLIETVGVGQDEVDVARTADATVVVLVPGTGDDVQAMKAGIMEIADVFVANKADREGIDRLVQSVEAALSLQPAEPGAWVPPVLKTEATTGRGLDELWATLQRFRERPGAARDARRKLRYRERVRQLVGELLLAQAERSLPAGLFERTIEDVAARRLDPYTAAQQLAADGTVGGTAPQGTA
jgi:LAO/AO transport system kinase